jgi:hypothetical protein
MSVLGGKRWRAALVTVALTGALAACGSDGTSPNQQPVSDAQIESDVAGSSGAQAASDASDYANADQNDYSSAASGVAPGLSTVAGGMMRARSGCPSLSTTFQLIFAGGSDTLNVDRTRTYFAAGGCQSGFDASTTDSVEYTSNDSLDVNASAWVDHATRVRAFSLTGAGGSTLATDTIHDWNGVGQGTDTSTYTGSVNTRSYAGVAYDTATAVAFLHPRNGEIYPQSGTLTRWVNWTLTVTGARNATLAVVRHVVVTFSGGSNDAALQVFDPSTGALKLTCTLDLLAHRVVPGSCH